MDEELRREVELEVGRLFRDDAGKHRDFLQSQLSQTKWAVGVLVAIMGIAVVATIGDSLIGARRYARDQIDQGLLAMITDEVVKEQVAQSIQVRVQEALVEAQPILQQRVTEQVEKSARGVEQAIINRAIDVVQRNIDDLDLSESLIPSMAILPWAGVPPVSDWLATL
jgi:hypothetical protein